MKTPFLNLNGSGILDVKAGNSGSGAIVANSLRITISVGTNTTILGLGAGSDTRWNVFFLGKGNSNTIVLTNKGVTPFSSSDLGIIHIRVKGTVEEDEPQTITGNISYIAGTNTLLKGLQSASQGNIDITDDNSTTSLSVSKSIKSVPVAAALTDFNISTNSCDAILNWKMESKNKVDSFEVEYGTSETQFTKAGAVSANNNAPVATYQYINDQGNGKGYYRLKIVEKGGKFSYSKTISVDTKCIIKKGF